ncbi:MAG: TetR/AcrR family transcriptional regulator [Actinomycetota bacterium]|nr:TetR/AcrR family transcriptional regulator [Actinomycetota bacterium]
MGRTARFSSDAILDAAADVVADGGPARTSIGSIAALLEAPSGSIYYRFASRDLLMASLWIRTARRSQQGALEAIAHPDVERAAVGAALHVVRWSRSHLTEARILMLYRREQLAAEWPDELGDELATLNRPLEEARHTFTRRLAAAGASANPTDVAFALVDVPFAAVRRSLIAGTAPPRRVDELVRLTCRTVLFGT